MAMTETHPKGRSSEETRNLYRQKYEAQIREWNVRADEIKAGAARPGRQAWLVFRSSFTRDGAPSMPSSEGTNDAVKSHRTPPQQKN